MIPMYLDVGCVDVLVETCISIMFNFDHKVLQKCVPYFSNTILTIFLCIILTMPHMSVM